MSKWQHDELAHDLALLKANGGRVVFENIPMGPSGSGRPDVFCISKSFTKPCITTYEIKVNRSDFLSDIRREKWRLYEPYSEYIYFAVPDGLVSPDEVPAECGLMVRKAKVWRTVKPAARSVVDTVDVSILVKLMIAAHSGDRCTDGGYRKHLENRYKAVDRIGKLLGSDVANYCSKNFTYRDRMDHKTKEASELIEGIREITGTPSWKSASRVVDDLNALIKKLKTTGSSA